MRLLTPCDAAAVRSLVSHAAHDLAVVAVAGGQAAGRVFVDDPANPGVALVSPHWGRLYLLGRADGTAEETLRESLRQVIMPPARAAGAAFSRWAMRPSGSPTWPALLDGLRVVPDERQYYRWAGQAAAVAALPAGFTLVPADGSLLANDGLRDLELLREEMASERASVDDFLARSFGIAAVYEDRLAGWCLSEYNTEARCEVGIASLEPFQRRGLAAAMGHAFLDLARAHGMREVGWHCWKRNVASAAAALKIGLHHVADSTVYVGWYDSADAPAWVPGGA